MTVGERMKNRRQELGISADTVADALGVSRATIFRYESGAIEKKPIDIIPPLAHVLHCSPAYLMGWEDEPKSERGGSFANRLRELRNDKGLSQDTIAETLGVARSTVAMWETDKSQPDGDKLVALADYFDVSTDYLLGRSNEKSRGEAGSVENPVDNRAGNSDPQLDRVLDAWEQLNEEGHERVADYAEDVAASGRYKKGGAPRVVEGA